MMTEREWVALALARLGPLLTKEQPNLRLAQGARLAYAEEIVLYKGSKAEEHHTIPYETDLLITEHYNDTGRLPRVVIEAKINSVTTHDAITYSRKAAAHKAVHPYLRYGIILGNRRHYPLPGRLYRHGAHFDFMQSWVGFEPTPAELTQLLELVLEEVNASRTMQEMIFNSRSRNRVRYTMLHRPLQLGSPDLPGNSPPTDEEPYD